MKDYTMIYNLLIRTDKLDTYQKSFLINILSNEEGFKISLKILSKRIPCSQRKLQGIIKSLTDIFILKVEKVKTDNGDWDSNKYLINKSKLLEFLEVGNDMPNVENEMPNVENEMPKGRECCAEQVGHEVPTKNTNKNTNKEYIEHIWSLYPLKKGKVKAFKSIEKILKIISLEELERVINRYIKYVTGRSNNTFKFPYQYGSTFFYSGYVDYLDSNYINDQDYKKNSSEILSVTLSDEELLGGKV